MAITSLPVTGANRTRPSTRSAQNCRILHRVPPRGLGFFHDDELFIIGRIKDLLIVYGRNHSPDDIEATIQLITRGRCVAISVPDDGIEKLVAIAELKDRGEAGDDVVEKFATVKNEVTSAISTSHGLSIADLVLVPPGSIPLTTSGKVRRRDCVEQYRQDQFARLDY
jgi:long-chain fatty acid adenylyltransferase FadD28